jgi:thiamine biosynthesis lipoprotein
VLTRARPLLGTLVEIKAISPDERIEWQAVNDAFDVIARVQRLMSAHDPTSDVGRLNFEGHREAVEVSPETFAVLERALQFSAWTDGVFDCTVGDRLVALKYLPDFYAAAAATNGSFRDIRLLDDRRVGFERPLRIDLGGIAKGFAVDQAVDTMRRCGATAGLVNAGGDLRGFGDFDWPVAVRHPQSPTHMLPMPPLRNAAIATTADYFAAREHDGELVNPIIDPRTHRSSPSTRSVSVVAPGCMDADAMTKIVWLGADPQGELLQRIGASAIVIETAEEARDEKRIAG